ncbi:AraC family transcriptional regulator [Treponema sp. R80B11-R83G3]
MALANISDYNKFLYKTNLYILLWENTENMDYPSHWHSAMELIMPIEGSYKVQLRNKTYLLKKNDILIIPPLAVHGITVPPDSKKGKRIILMVEPTVLFSLPGISDPIIKQYNLNLITHEEMPEIHSDIQRLLMDCYNEYKKGDIYQITAMYAKIIDIFVILSRYYDRKLSHRSDTQTYKRQDYIVKLNSVFEYIESHLTDKLTLEKLAKVAHYSKFHFERIFKVFTGMSFNQFLKMKRVFFSEALLLDPKLTIIDTAMKSGFGSISAFNQAFKKTKHCTPSEFRKMRQQ